MKRAEETLRSQCLELIQESRLTSELVTRLLEPQAGALDESVTALIRLRAGLGLARAVPDELGELAEISRRAEVARSNFDALRIAYEQLSDTFTEEHKRTRTELALLRDQLQQERESSSKKLALETSIRRLLTQKIADLEGGVAAPSE